MTTPESSLDQNRLNASYVAALRQVRTRVRRFLDQVWEGLPDHREGQIEAFTRVVVSAVIAGQRDVASLTDSFLSRLLTQMTGNPFVPAGVATAAVVGEAVRNGTDPAEVYARPFVEVWTALSEGESFDSAKGRGKDRLRKLAETDMQLAKTHASREVLSRHEDRVSGYERTLTGAENCALCVVASTQRYHVRDLMPIHPACDCGVRPIVGPDPGQVINPERLEELHDTLNEQLGVSDRGGRAPDYRKVITTRQHGEYGPTLVIGRHDFTGPGEVP